MRMKISKDAVDFNKELLFGELGAIIGAQISSYICSKISSSISVISAFTVIGAIIGAAVFFLSLRIYYKIKNKDFSRRKLVGDLLYFTPVAFILTSIIYYPSLFFFEKYFLTHQYRIAFSTFVSQALAYLFFLISINIYRYILLKTTGKNL